MIAIAKKVQNNTFKKLFFYHYFINARIFLSKNRSNETNIHKTRSQIGLEINSTNQIEHSKDLRKYSATQPFFKPRRTQDHLDLRVSLTKVDCHFCLIHFDFFFMSVLLRSTSFLTTFYGLYFSHLTHYNYKFLMGL